MVPALFFNAARPQLQMERDDPEALKRAANGAISRAQLATMKANGSAASNAMTGSAAPAAGLRPTDGAAPKLGLSEAEGASLQRPGPLSPVPTRCSASNCTCPRLGITDSIWSAVHKTDSFGYGSLHACADALAAIDFSITEDSLEQPPAAEKLPPGAPGLAKMTVVVTEEDGQRVRRTLHDLTARLLGVDTPPLPSIRERRKLALQYAQV